MDVSEQMNNNEKLPTAAVCGWPHQLEDARMRVGKAKEDYSALKPEIERWLYEYVGGMIVPADPSEGAGTFAIQLRHPSDSYISGKPAVLVAQIAEGLRAALDYTICQLSKTNDPNCNEKLPEFVITESKKDFDNLRKSRLKYLDEKQLAFVEQLQPYNGNTTLKAIRDITNSGKHRELLRILDLTSSEIHIASWDKRSSEYQGWFAYRTKDETGAVFAKYDRPLRLSLLGKYDAYNTLECMIHQVEELLWAFSHCFCPDHGQLPTFRIEYD